MLIALHQAFYPSVHFRIDWDEEDANGDAYVQHGTRHVVLLGGLLRVEPIAAEGVALVLAHELAHHYAGCPCLPGGISCEGRADYFGAGQVMRRVWGSLYQTVLSKAIAQIGVFFDCLAGVKRTNLGCGYPPVACRIATYEAALAWRPAPPCSLSTAS